MADDGGTTAAAASITAAAASITAAAAGTTASITAAAAGTTAKKPYLLPRSFTYHHHHRPSPKPTRSSFSGDRVVLYFTSLRGVRRTHADCSTVRAILRGFRVAVDERDVSMDASFRRELQSLLGSMGKPFSLPQLFVGCRLVGGADEVRRLHEAGELRVLLEGAAGQDPAFVCGGCGGVRFVPCSGCGGSRKVFVEEEGRMRRCEECNENGLVRCPNCCSY